MIPCRLLACSCHEMQLQSNLPTNYLGLIANGPTWLFDLLAHPIVRLIVSRCFVCRAVISGPVVLPGSSRNDLLFVRPSLGGVAFRRPFVLCSCSFVSDYLRQTLTQTNNIKCGVSL